MKDINIVAATALQAIDPIGREKAVKIGANILMPNITPGKYRDSYKLYDNKPCTDDSAEDCQSCSRPASVSLMQKLYMVNGAIQSIIVKKIQIIGKSDIRK